MRQTGRRALNRGPAGKGMLAAVLCSLVLTVFITCVRGSGGTGASDYKTARQAEAAGQEAADHQVGADPDAFAPTVNLAYRGIEDGQPLPSFQRNQEEALAYCDALVKAYYSSTERFARSAVRDVTYAHLYEEPARHRGQVVHVEGRLTRVRKFEAPMFTWSQGVHDLYEGWIFDLKHYGANPVCVVFTELPAGLQVAETMDRSAHFNGYFFKRYAYKGADTWRNAPLLIGHAPVLGDEMPAGAAVSSAFLWTVFGLLGSLVLLVGGLAWWYRRGDHKVRSRLATYQRPLFLESAPVPEEFTTQEAINSEPPEPELGNQRDEHVDPAR